MFVTQPLDREERASFHVRQNVCSVSVITLPPIISVSLLPSYPCEEMAFLDSRLLLFFSNIHSEERLLHTFKQASQDMNDLEANNMKKNASTKHTDTCAAVSCRLEGLLHGALRWNREGRGGGSQGDGKENCCLSSHRGR